MKSLIDLILFLIGIALYQNAVAAPSPLTGLSLFNKPETSLALSEMGFEIRNLPKNWIYKNPLNITYADNQTKNSKTLELAPAASSTSASLSFRLEKTGKKINIEGYVKQFLRDYNQYGFEVVQLKSFKQSTKPFVVVDLLQKNRSHRSRQVFFQNKDQILIATCLDEFNKFDSTIKSCNQIIESMNWLE